MSFPPQPPPDDPRSGQGGGFGPPPGGFGPPQYQPQPYQPQPYQPPQAPYQQQPQQGGYGGYPPPQPPPRSGGGAKIAAIVIGAVVLVAVIVGGLAVALGGDDDKDAASSSSSPTASASTSSEPTDDTTASPSPAETFRRYVVLDIGQCFNDPGLDSGVTEVTPVPCTGPHDAEVIAHEKITGTFATEAALKKKVLQLCEADAGKRLDHITDNRTFYYYALYPKLAGYQVQGKNTVSCSLTLSNKPDGEKLTKPLS